VTENKQGMSNSWPKAIGTGVAAFLASYPLIFLVIYLTATMNGFPSFAHFLEPRISGVIAIATIIAVKTTKTGDSWFRTIGMGVAAFLVSFPIVFSVMSRSPTGDDNAGVAVAFAYIYATIVGGIIGILTPFAVKTASNGSWIDTIYWSIVTFLTVTAGILLSLSNSTLSIAVIATVLVLIVLRPKKRQDGRSETKSPHQ